MGRKESPFPWGREVLKDSNDFTIEPRSSLEYVFECEQVVGDAILEYFSDFDDAGDEQYVNVSALMNVFQSNPYGAMSFRMDEKIRLPIPKP